jgi:hypothetical protein
MPTSLRPHRALALLAIVAAATIGCEVAVVDLGSNHPDAGGAGGDGGLDAGTGGSTGPVTTSDCPGVTEAEQQVLYGHPCGGSTCADAMGAARVIGSAAELASVLETQWRTCAGDVPWPAGVVGLEFQPGCTIFLLHDAPDGGVARGVLPEDQGNFNVVETKLGDAVTRTLALYFPTFTWEVAATTSDCPHRLLLTGAHGSTVGFAAVSGAPGPQ